jgi:hypothetical protein
MLLRNVEWREFELLHVMHLIVLSSEFLRIFGIPNTLFPVPSYSLIFQYFSRILGCKRLSSSLFLLSLLH